MIRPLSPTPSPWPADAVMIVAALAGEQGPIDAPVVTSWCRDCDREVAACSRTLSEAVGLPCRRGRPVKYFCPDCAVRYASGTIELFIDRR